jgi:hypothetical protein
MGETSGERREAALRTHVAEIITRETGVAVHFDEPALLRGGVQLAELERLRRAETLRAFGVPAELLMPKRRGKDEEGPWVRLPGVGAMQVPQSSGGREGPDGG